MTREAIAVLVAYGMITHNILMAFAVTAMALGMQGQSDSMFVGSASTKQLIMVLCRPGSSTDSSGPDDVNMPDGTHLKGCCGFSVVSSAGLKDFTSAPPYIQSTDILWYRGQALWPETYRFTPAARGPPIA